MIDKPPQARPQGHLMTIKRWPTERWPEGVGISVKDGWYFGIGFGLAMFIAVPMILIFMMCIAGIGLTMVGGSLL